MERGFERICGAFENHFEKRGDYHEKLIQRMTLSLPGIRPAFLPERAVEPLRELKGFRHIFRHAYDLNLIKDRLEPLVTHAESIATDHPKRIEAFINEVQTQLE